MSYSASYTLYDPIYAAKVKNAVREETIRIDEGDYESFQNGTLADSEDLNEAVADTRRGFRKNHRQDHEKAALEKQRFCRAEKRPDSYRRG